MSKQKYTPNELENEIWKDIPGYKGLYQASSAGRVKRLKSTVRVVTRWGTETTRTYPNRILKPSKLIYQKVSLSKRNQVKTIGVHTLIALTFLGARPNRLVVNHRNGNKHDNRVSNLEYVTVSEDRIHSYTVLGNCPSGPKGSRNPGSKLTPEIVREARFLYSTGNYTYRSIAAKYGVDHKTILKAIKGETWAHVS